MFLLGLSKWLAKLIFKVASGEPVTAVSEEKLFITWVLADLLQATSIQRAVKFISTESGSFHDNTSSVRKLVCPIKQLLLLSPHMKEL